jgi:transcriptional regulator with XRE-family HTH domain
MQKNQTLSASLLQQRLKKRMADMGISVHALEKQAGLKRSAVQNILQGRSKNPSAKILQAVSKILGCDINDLLTRNDVVLSDSIQFANTSTQTLDNSSDNDAIFNADLYLEAITTAKALFAEFGLTPSLSQAVNYIQEIYLYAISSQSTTIDKNFAAWLAKKSITP